ncbi:ribosome-recycling factor [Nocardia sp. NPDC051832]|uniref:ribosome-recycling factor n=1 Tax=Nocardia sp. NPDC051832 TaxID=3155673 RepID=UPI003440607D
MINEVHQDAVIRTGDRYTAFANALSALLGTGPLDDILVDHAGSKIPLLKLAQVDTKGPTSSIAAFDRAVGSAIRHAIVQAGFQVRISGKIIRVTAPQSNPREQIARIEAHAEQARAEVRGVYEDLSDRCRLLLADGIFSADEERRTRSVVQRVTDATISNIDLAATRFKAMAKGHRPEAMDDWDLTEFTRTYDGYAAFDDDPIELGRAVQHVRQLWDQTGLLSNDLTLLRTCLFLQVKAHRHRGDGHPLSEQPFVRALAARIRDVSGGVPWSSQ